jgi:guanine deaminase
VPGFIDTHTHGAQYAFIGSGLDLSLLEWLEKYTFPVEKRFTDLEYSRKTYEKSVNSHINQGTTTICFYGTIYNESTQILADISKEKGIRAYIGKVCMDRNCPLDYREKSC